MDAVYLCLTCLKVSAISGECHDRPMICCGNFGSAQPKDAAPAPAHWLVETVAALNLTQPEEPAE